MGWSTIYILGMLQALLLATLLFKTRNSRWTGNIYIAAILIVIALLLGVFALRLTQGLAIYPFFFWLVVSTPVLIGPLFLFYIRAFQSRFNLFDKRNLLHLLPFIALIANRKLQAWIWRIYSNATNKTVE